MQPLMDRVLLLASAASRARQLNEILGTHLTPDEIERAYAVEDIDILLAWSKPKD